MSDTWAVSPAAADATFFRAAATIAGAGALTLLKTDTSVNTCGYKLIITAASTAAARTFTIVGTVVGQPKGTVTEVIAGPATNVLTTNYWVSITSISCDAAFASNISIGISGSLALPRCRIKSVYAVGAAAAGSVSVAMAVSGKVIVNLDTPASVAAVCWLQTGDIPVYAAVAQDFGVVTLTQVTKTTLICG